MLKLAVPWPAPSSAAKVLSSGATFGLVAGDKSRWSLIRRKDQALCFAEVVIIFFEIAAQAELAGYVFRDADKAETWIVQGDAILRVPTM